MSDDRPGEAYKLPDDAATNLELRMDAMNESLPKMTHFILPGGAPVLSYAHLCRTVCRRAERRTVELAETVEMDRSIIVYLNRLSDYFFVLGRFLAKEENIEEVKWVP